MKFYDVWGTELAYNHMSAGWSWAFDTPFDWFKQNASRLGGVNQNMVVSVADAHQGQGRPPPAVRHVIDVVPTILEVTGISAPEIRRRHPADADRGHQLRLHIRRSQRERAVAPQDPVLRDDGPVGAVRRRLAAEHQGGPCTMAGLRRGEPGPAEQPGVPALRPDQELQPGGRHRRQDPHKVRADAGSSSTRRRSTRSSRWTPRLAARVVARGRA